MDEKNDSSLSDVGDGISKKPDEYKKNTVLRWSLFSLGFFLMLMGIFMLWNLYFPVLKNLMGGNLDFKVQGSFWPGLIVFLIGYAFYFVGRNWRSIFKGITNSLVTIAILLFSFSLVLYPLNVYSDDIASSVQPTIDMILAESLDDVFDGQVEIRNGDNVVLILSNNTEILEIYNSNITQTQADILALSIGADSLLPEDKVLLSKFLITSVSEQAKTQPELHDVAIPLEIIEGQLAELGMSENIFETIDFGVLATILPVDNSASIKILLSENSEEKTVTIGDLSDEDVLLIWNNLGFVDEVSISSKRKLTNIMLSLYLTELEKVGFANTPFPVASLAGAIPEDYKEFSKYDLYSESLSVRAEAIINIREDCLSGYIGIDEVCDMILFTDYDYLMKNLDSLENVTEEEGLDIPIVVYEGYDSIENIENSLYESSKSWLVFFIVGLVLIGVSFATYYLHFSLFGRELIGVHIPYYISKQNLFSTIPFFIIFWIFHYVVTNNIIFDFVSDMVVDESVKSSLESFSSLPITFVIYDMFDLMFSICVYYLLISILFFALMYGLIRKKVYGSLYGGDKENKL